MNKIYISSLLVVLMAGAQATRAQDSDLDAMMAELGAPAVVESGEGATVQGEVSGTVQQSPVQDLYSKGVEAYQNEDYDRASKIFEAILTQDPYDTRAMAYLRRTSDKVAAKAERLKSATQAKAMSDTELAWVPQLDSKMIGSAQSEEKAVSPEDVAIQAMTKRLKDIRIPTLDFRDANIKDVVLFLTETCRRMDEVSHKGINFLLLGLASSDEMGADEGNNITISVRNMSLYDSIQAIVEMAALKFEVQPNMVVIMPANYVRSIDLVEEEIDVISEVGDELASLAGGGDSGGGMDDLFGESTSVAEPSGPVDIKGYFSYIDWPSQGVATYYPAFKKILVKNTPENIKVVKGVINELTDRKVRERSNQVLIEAKFVEFAEGAYEELGFNWTVYGSGTLPGGMELAGSSGRPITTFTSGAGIEGTVVSASGPYTDPSAGYYANIGTSGGRTGGSLFSAGQRSGSQVYETVTAGLLSTMGGVAPSMIFSNGDVDMKISAMEQEGAADILSTPKVTTQSGNEAVIRVVEIHRYPQDYDVETGQRTAPIVKPQDWEDFDLGIVLRVTPDVDTERRTILLQMEPEIRKFQGFEDYEVAINSLIAFAGVPEYGFGDTLYARMPYFETRSVSTRVTIADGATVAMGGLIDERTETYRDQVPFLGDIPFVGRLFRTEGSRSVKKNLVIYVKATQVDERGMTAEDREMLRTAAN